MDGLVVQAPKEAMVGPEVSKPPELVHLETVGQPAKTAKASASGMSKVGRTGRSTQKAMQLKTCTNLKSDGAKPSQCATPKSSASASTIRRNSTGGFAEKQSVEMSKGKKTTTSVGNEKSIPSVSRSVRQSLPEMRRSSSTADGSENLEQATKKSGPISPASRTLRSSSSISASNAEPVRKPSFSQSTVSSTRKANSPSLESTGSNTGRKSVSRISSSMSSKSLSMSSGIKIGNPISSSSGRSQSTSCEFKNGSSPSSKDRGSNLSGKRKTASAEGKDSHYIVLPQVEIKAGDDVRLDLRGHRIRSLSSGGMNLSQNLEFVYLRDNLLASVEGVEILTRVKVLDLSFNEFKGPGFEPLGNCKFLQQLYLAGNQITSLSTLPELPNLEFLSVAQNKLKSLAMACQPRLQVLAASRNKISTLKGFPYLPVLEHLRLEENPILQMPHLQAASILLVGPTLKKFNDRDLSKNEVAVAKHYPAHAAICIQNGWEFCSPEHAEDSTFSFLAGRWMDQLPPGFHIKEASVDPPFVEDACRCHFIFAQDRGTESKLVLQYQWFLGDKALSSFVAIPDANSEVYSPTRKEVGKLLKVECTPILEDAKYAPIFAISTTVSPGTGCPKVLNLDVHGDLVEGSTIRGYADVAWCGGTPGKGVSSWLRRRWNSSPVVVPGAEDEDYLLTLDDVDSSLVYMYTPVTKEGTKGEPQYAITDFVIAATPSVTNVRIIGELVEDNVIRGAGDYFGGQEGPSSFEWFLEDKDTGEFSLVIAGSAEYVLTKEDVGRRISFVYIPINFEGKEGEAVSVVSTVVRRAPPRVINLKVIGDMREGSKITVSGTVTGGTEGASRVQWFKSSSTSLDGEDGLEALSTSKISKAFRIPLGAVGHFIVAKFTPMTPDGDAGLPTYAISNDTVETLPPSLNFLSVTGESLEGEILTASYGYIGGHEGKSIYRWYLHEDETQPGILIEEASGLLQYHIPKGAIGRYVCFECTPVRDDGIMGEPKSCMGQDRVRAGSPRLLSLEVIGQWIEGTTLQADITYWGGDEGNSIFQWFRTSSDGQTFEIDCASHASYTLRVEDIGYFISVSCKPVRSDSACGPKIVSEQIGPIVPGQPRCQALDFSGMMVEGKRLSVLASYCGGTRGNCRYDWYRLKNNGIKERLCAQEFVDLSLEDVGCSIEIVFTPIRDDGVEGIPQSILSDVIAAGDPVGLHLSIPDCCENKEVVPRKMYFGGIEGPGQYLWFRVENKLDDSSLIATIDSHEVFICGHEQNYTPSLDDVGYYLVLHWIPIRDDGKAGLPVVAISSDPVTPAPPMVDNVRANELSMNIYSGEGEYFGGKEGSSLFSWYRETADGTLILINGANAQTYEVTVLDYNCRLLFGYTPVRSDSVVGELRLSEPTNIILPEPVQIELLAITGKTFEGEVLTAVEVIPKSDAQQHVWATYKKDVSYQWYCSTDSGDSSSFEPLPSQRSCSYRLRFEDIGRRLKCQCIVTDVFGRSSEPAYAETTQILAGIPRIDKLEIEGRGFHTNLYALKGNYSGGREGKSRIQWLRSMVGSPDLISIPGETRRMYEANVDDVGYRLVAIYTPVREDGVEGPPVSASTDPITVEPDVLTEVKKKLEVGSVKFEVLYDKDLPSKKTLGLGSIERRFLEVKRKRVKVIKPGTKTSFPSTEIRGSYAPPFHVETSRNDQHRLRIVVDSESIVDIMVHTRHLRDVIVLVIRGFAQRFNSTSLNSLLKMDAQ